MIVIISCECDALFFGQRDVYQVGQQHQTESIDHDWAVVL